MVKGEHLRPLVGFLVVCGVAALILATGLTSPAALRRIVAEQRLLPSPSLTELVLGRTLDAAPARQGTQGTGPAAAVEERSSLVLSGSAQGASTRSGQAATTHAGSPKPHPRGDHAVKATTQTTHTTHTAQTTIATAPTTTTQPAQAAAPVTTTQPASQPTSKPVATAVATGSTHHSVQAPSSGDGATSTGDTRGRSHDHSPGRSHGHSRGPRSSPLQGRHGSHASTQHAQVGSSAVAAGHHQSAGAGSTHGHLQWHGDHGQDHTHGDHTYGHRH